MATAFRANDESDEYRCPNCAEVIKKDAIMCRFCNRGLSLDYFYHCPACAEMVRNQATQCKTCNAKLTPRPEPRALTMLAGGADPSTKFTINDALVRARVEVCKQALKAELPRAWLDKNDMDSAPSDFDDPLFWVKLDSANHEALRAMARQRLAVDNSALTMMERGLALMNLLDDILGFGPLGPLLRDPSVDRILISGPDKVFVTRDGHNFDTDVIFASKKDLDERIAVIVHTYSQSAANGLNIYTAASGWLASESLSEALREETVAFQNMSLVMILTPRRK